MSNNFFLLQQRLYNICINDGMDLLILKMSILLITEPFLFIQTDEKSY